MPRTAMKCRNPKCGSENLAYFQKSSHVQIAYLLAPGQKCPIPDNHEYQCKECHWVTVVDRNAYR